MGDSTVCPICLLEGTRVGMMGSKGPYQLESLIGQGGMGYVYLAMHEQTGRLVALKIPKADFIKSRHFLQEARALSTLDHPAIMSIYELSDKPDDPWFAMKLAEGGTLADRLEKGALPPREAVEIMAVVASGVKHAHDHGILHRDLKPGNVLLDERGLPLLADFGLARWSYSTENKSHLANSSELGTPGYASPESISGLSPSAAGDIFSLGALLYHLLAGHPPFKAATLEATLALAAAGKVEPLTRRGLPADLWRICRKCLEPVPTDRYPTAGLLESDLRAWLAGNALSIRPHTPAEKLRRLIRRNPIITALSLVTALALVAMLAIALRSSRLILVSERQKAEIEAQLAEEWRHTDRLNYIELMLTSQFGERRKSALDMVQEAWKLKPGPELRSLAIRALTLSEYTMVGEMLEPRDIFHERVPIGTVTSADGKGTATVRPNTPKQVIIKPGADQPEVVLNMDGEITALSWNPQGDMLAIACHDKSVQVWRADSQTLDPPLVGESAALSFLWHPQHRHVALITQNGVIRIWSLDKADFIITVPLGAVLKPGLSWGEGGRYLYWTSADGKQHTLDIHFAEGVRYVNLPHSARRREAIDTIDLNAQRGLVMWTTDDGVNLWNWHSGKRSVIIPKRSNEWLGARFTSAGVQAGGWNTGLRTLNYDMLAGSEPLSTYVEPKKIHIGKVLISVSPDEKWLGILNRPGDGFQVVPADKPTALPLALSHTMPFAMAFSKDATLAASSSFREPGVRLWQLPEGKPLLTLPVEETTTKVVFSPDSQSVLTVGRRLAVLWDVKTGEKKITLPTTDNLGTAAWSPDGKVIAFSATSYVALHNAADGALIARLYSPLQQPSGLPVSIAFDRRENILATQLTEGSVVLWDIDYLTRELQVRGLGW